MTTVFDSEVTVAAGYVDISDDKIICSIDIRHGCKITQTAKFIIYIQEVSVSNLGRNTDYS
jgi:hypothetical protein